MLKTLLKKQLLETNQWFYVSRKTGKRRGRGGVITYIALFMVCLGILAALSGGLSYLLGTAIFGTEYEWVYFALMAIISVLFGTFGSVFNTYAGLYQAKDNEMLLSLPIPPSKILAVRMISVYLYSLLYSALIWVPAAIMYMIMTPFRALSMINMLLLTFVLALFVLALTCALGYVVALIASRLRNKAFLSVFMTLLFLAVYYSISFRLQAIIQYITEHIATIGDSMRTVLYPFYATARAAQGSVAAMLGVTAAVLLIGAIVLWIMSRSFIRLITTNRGIAKKKFVMGAQKRSSTGRALLKKELKRLTTSPSYLMNSSLASLLMVVAAGAAFIKLGWVRNLLTEFSGLIPSFATRLPLMCLGAVCLLCAMNSITAPSISLEGKNLWILRSLPVDTLDILHAKLNLEMVVTVPAAALVCAAMLFAVNASALSAVLTILTVIAFVRLHAAAGLMLNLHMPNLKWNNENVPVKQSLSVFLSMFGSWAVITALGFAVYFTRNALGGNAQMIAVLLLLVVLNAVLELRLRGRGRVLFEEL